MFDTGRPPYSEDEYRKWLDLMTPFLTAGNSLSYSIIKCGLTQHRTTLYEKMKLNDWFSDKIHDLQSIPGELANETFYLLIKQINEKVKAGVEISANETAILKHFSERHRSCQSFFINRQEIIQSESLKIEQLMDDLERQSTTDYSLFGIEAQKELEKYDSSPQV